MRLTCGEASLASSLRCSRTEVRCAPPRLASPQMTSRYDASERRPEFALRRVRATSRIRATTSPDHSERRSVRSLTFLVEGYFLSELRALLVSRSSTDGPLPFSTKVKAFDRVFSPPGSNTISTSTVSFGLPPGA